MARVLSQALIPKSSLSIKSSSFSPSSLLINHRNRSNRSEKVQLIEIDLDAENTEVEILALRRLEEAISGIMAQRSAPVWLPFRPGSSYWVPPSKRPLGLVELVKRLSNPMTEEESLSFTSVRGWPSSAYFFEGASAPQQPVETISKKTEAQSEDDEG